MSRGPDPSFVSDALREIGRHRGAQDRSFAQAVTMRLEVGAQEYGNTYKERELVALLDEVREELADAPGWLILALDLIYDYQESGRLTDDDAHFLRLKLIGIAAGAQFYWRELTDIRAWLDDPTERVQRNM